MIGREDALVRRRLGALRGGFTPGRIVSALVWGQRSEASPQVRAFLAQHGTDQIVDLAVIRAPISAATNALVDLLSLGDWGASKRAAGYRRLFHAILAVTIRSADGASRRMVIEKNPVMRIRPLSPKDAVDAQIYRLRMPHGISLASFIIGGAARCGRRFWDYEPRDANCQDFVVCLLAAHGILTPGVHRFVKQPTDRVLANPLTHGVTAWGSDLAARVDILANGGCNSNGIPCL